MVSYTVRLCPPFTLSLLSRGLTQLRVIPGKMGLRQATDVDSSTDSLHEETNSQQTWYNVTTIYNLSQCVPDMQ